MSSILKGLISELNPDLQKRLAARKAGQLTSFDKPVIEPKAGPAAPVQPAVQPTELQKRLAARKAGKPVYSGGLEEDRQGDLEVALSQARKITKGIKYDDTAIDIIVQIQMLAEKYNIDKDALETAIDEVYTARSQLESAIYKLDDVFEDALQQSRRDDDEVLDENLRKWFKEKWVRFGPDGKIRGDCARGDDSEGKPKCLPQSKAHSLGKKGRASAAARKRREDPNPERSGKAINVNTKKKSNEGVAETSDYFRRREREEAIISGQKLARKKQPAQTSDYARRREQEKKAEKGVAEANGQWTAGLAQTMGSFGAGFSSSRLEKAIVYYLQGRHQEGASFLSTALSGTSPKVADKIKAQLEKLPRVNVDPNTDANTQKYIKDKVIPWINSQLSAGTSTAPSTAVLSGQSTNYSVGISDNVAAQKIADKIKGMPVNSTNIQNYVKKYLSMTGKNEKDLPQLSLLVYDILKKQGMAEEQLDEKCWDTHKQVGMKSKGGRMVPNCVPKESVHEAHQQCPECGGAMYEASLMNEKKDACYYKVKSRYKVWPSAYASGALVKCRKRGASNWGTGSKKNEDIEEGQIYSTGGGAGQSYRKYKVKPSGIAQGISETDAVNRNDGDGWRWTRIKPAGS